MARRDAGEFTSFVLATQPALRRTAYLLCGDWQLASDHVQDALIRVYRHWPRLRGEFHGSGCTLASSIAARLALGDTMAQALELGQRYCDRTLAHAYAIAPGQRIPRRIHP